MSVLGKRNTKADAYHLPDLHDVVFGHRTNHPWFSWIPGEIGDFSCMTTVYELQSAQVRCSSILFKLYVLVILVDRPRHRHWFAPHRFYLKEGRIEEGRIKTILYLRSHTCNRRSVPLDARIVSLWCDHCTWKISSLCDSKVCNFSLRLRRSHSATV